MIRNRFTMSYKVAAMLLMNEQSSRSEISAELYYSDLRLSTGFALAAFIVCEKIVVKPREAIIIRLVPNSRKPICAA